MRQVMNDPVHGLMNFGMRETAWFKLFKVLIDHPLFQRLRHIKQLGMADLVFPGAVHTRFNHSIGVTYVAARITEALQDFLPTPIDPAESLGLKFACLLHDIGHGPFSHAFEELTMLTGIEPVTHEDWVPYFQAEFPKIALPTEPVWKEIISSQLDADRMDYLLRDAHFCGVAYGHFDLPWVIHCLRCVRVQGQLHLGISYKGISAVESYLLARRLMTRNVYHHPKIKRVQAMMIEFLRACCESIEEEAFAAFRKEVLGKFLWELKRYRRGQCTKVQFMDTAFQYYQQLTDHHMYACLGAVMAAPLQYPATIHDIAQRLYQRELPKIIPIEPARFPEIKYRIEQLQKEYDLASWRLGVEQPIFSTYSKEDVPILVEYPSGAIEDLGKNPILQAVGTKEAEMAVVYVDKPLAPLLKTVFQLRRKSF